MIVPGPQPKSSALLASLLAALVFLAGFPTAARTNADCRQTYVNCVQAASDLDGVPRRSWAGLRCADDPLACLQHRPA